jgi:squalene cyclase
LFEVLTVVSECLTKQEYTEIEKSNVVQTAWAMMGLIHAGQASGD